MIGRPTLRRYNPSTETRPQMLKNIFKGSNGLRGLAPADVCRAGRRSQLLRGKNRRLLPAWALAGHGQPYGRTRVFSRDRVGPLAGFVDHGEVRRPQARDIRLAMETRLLRSILASGRDQLRLAHPAPRHSAPRQSLLPMGAAHTMNPGWTVLGLTTVFGFGLVACFLLRRTGTCGCPSACTSDLGRGLLLWHPLQRIDGQRSLVRGQLSRPRLPDRHAIRGGSRMAQHHPLPDLVARLRQMVSRSKISEPSWPRS